MHGANCAAVCTSLAGGLRGAALVVVALGISVQLQRGSVYVDAQ
jgi:hypothetical protein